jgi:hypothetical protein
MLQGCFILGQVIYDDDDCRLYYIYSKDPDSGYRTLEWDSYYCGAGGGLTRAQWDAKYNKLQEQNPETIYVQEIFEYTDGASYRFDPLEGFVLEYNPNGW